MPCKSVAPLALLLTFVTASALADEEAPKTEPDAAAPQPDDLPAAPKPEDRFPGAGPKAESRALVRFIGLLGRSKIDDAIDVLDELTPNGMSDDDRRKFELLMTPFRRVVFAFESVDCLGLRRISTQTYEVHFMGHGRGGPVWFQFRMYRYEKKWRVVNVTFVADWVKFREIKDFKPFDPPIAYPLELSGDDVTLR